ncbi:hypothetical protein AQUCO_01700336v1 [Aquilegia coerulea]|uniref:Mechanosensitive ion channel MscS domain-containing protein n=2 Tax=Aquilegia coerulea TaxID=218851 RepID=A0A2G5DMC6_AQUCA|nr:hypothetical protein AQUCO_01700336v1 [Aquilegia coerulea]
MQFLRSYSPYMRFSKLSDHIHILQSRSRAFSSKKSSGKDLPPVNTKFAKHFRGTMKGESSNGNQLSFGGYALRALEPAWLTSKQIGAGRKAITGFAHRAGKVWVRVIPDKCITGRPVGVRMGRGKGPFKYSAAVVKPGRILYEISGVSEMVAKEAITLAASKLPIRTQFVNGSIRTRHTSAISPAKIRDTLALSQNQYSSGFSPICAQNNGLTKMPYQSAGFSTCVSGVSGFGAYSSFYGNEGDGSMAKGFNVDNSDGIGTDGGNTLKNAWQYIADAESFLQQKAKDATEAHTPHVGGMGGVATAFATREIVGNVLSWLSMQFTRPFTVGNTIKAGSLEGEVVEMGLTTTSFNFRDSSKSSFS